MFKKDSVYKRKTKTNESFNYLSDISIKIQNYLFTELGLLIEDKAVDKLLKIIFYSVLEAAKERPVVLKAIARISYNIMTKRYNFRISKKMKLRLFEEKEVTPLLSFTQMKEILDEKQSIVELDLENKIKNELLNSPVIQHIYEKRNLQTDSYKSFEEKLNSLDI